MKTTSIRARKEIVLCTNCGRSNIFLYLSDFSYGERLIIYNNGRDYAYINLLDDMVYSSFEHIVIEILQNHNKQVSKDNLIVIINNIFGITCDEISGIAIKFDSVKRKCDYCLSQAFNDDLVEPESVILIELPLITHEKWTILQDEEQRNLVEKELKSRQII